MELRTIKEADLQSKHVLIRCELNVPLDDDGVIVNDQRIKTCLPTIQYCIQRGAKVIVLAHLGRPKGKVVEKLKMDNVAARIGQLLGKKVTKLDACIGPQVKSATEKMKPGDVIVLENVRFYN